MRSFQPLEDILLRARSRRADPLSDRYAFVLARLVEETPDGFLQSHLLQFAEVEHQRLARDLIATGRTAHESGAVYLAIKAFPAEEQPLLLSTLDARYERRYEVLAEVIDESCGSTQLQRVVAWCAIRLAFGSRFALRFASGASLLAERAASRRRAKPSEVASGAGLLAERGRGELVPGLHEQPDARLQHLLDVFGPGGLEALESRHAALCARLGLARFDPHDEPAWARLGGRADALDLIEHELALSLERWWSAAAQLEVIPRQDLGEVRGAVVRATASPDLAWRRLA